MAAEVALTFCVLLLLVVVAVLIMDNSGVRSRAKAAENRLAVLEALAEIVGQEGMAAAEAGTSVIPASALLRAAPTAALLVCWLVISGRMEEVGKFLGWARQADASNHENFELLAQDLGSRFGHEAARQLYEAMGRRRSPGERP